MSSIIVRPARFADLDSLIRFNQGIARETEGRELDETTLRAGLHMILADTSLGFYLVAATDERVVGSLMVTKEWSDWRNGVFWWIQSVYVESEFRRQGVYRNLYQRVEKLAAEHQVCGFRLYVERDNNVAQETYTSMGMRETPYKMFEQLRPQMPTTGRKQSG